jgi:hypothetical protein
MVEAWSRGRGRGDAAGGSPTRRGPWPVGMVETREWRGWGRSDGRGRGGRRGPWGSGGGLQVAAVDVAVAGRPAASRIRVRRRPSARLSCAPAGCEAEPTQLTTGRGTTARGRASTCWACRPGHLRGWAWAVRLISVKTAVIRFKTEKPKVKWLVILLTVILTVN